MKNLANLNSTEWCDIIFENKNKEYGAFALRQTSWKRHLLAFGLILAATVFVSFLPMIVESVEAKTSKISVIIDDEREVSVLERPEEVIAEMLPATVPEPPKFIKMDKLVPPTIVEDDKISEEDETMKTMSELIESNAAIGAYNVEDGSTDEDAVRKTTEVLITSDGNGSGKEVTTGPVTFAEVMPQFPGGEAELYRFIGENLNIL